jgi:TnpA family transposase
LGKALIKAKEKGIDPFEEIEKIMPWSEFINSVNDASKIARPKEYDYLDLLHTQYKRLRRYTPVLLKTLSFNASNTGRPIINALETIAGVNNSNKKKIPKGSPLDFVPKRWEKHVYDEDGNINRQYYELAAFTKFRNAVRSGDISIIGSRQYKDFDGYLISKEEWQKYKLKLTRDMNISLSVDEYLSERSTVLYKKLEWLSKNIEILEDVTIDKDKFVLSKLGKATPEEAKELSYKLYSMIPSINLTDLLIEVSNWTGFEKQFIHASTNKEPSENDKTIIMATLMALGTNIGLNKMSQATTEKISYNQLSNISNWRMYDDALNKAEATIVNFQHNQGLSQYWGEGTTSSSDGMRVQNTVSSLNSSHNPHYGSEKGVTIYRFTSDQYSSFYSTVINTNSRDAIHVIDGLLHHETELNIEEHYTDTAGYTDQIFALTHILGFRFAPRLRDLSDSKLYILDKTDKFINIKEIFKGKINAKIIKEHYDDVLRLIYSIKEGKVSGSLIMSKIGSYSRQNGLATALRELGRIEKTIFILDYVSSKPLRRRIQKGLNKGEAMNALARAIFFEKNGTFHDRAMQDQLQKSSALNILINAITLWNTVYLSKAIEKLKEKESFNEELLKNISPLAWEHINFVGEYNFNSDIKYDFDNLRPLKKDN